jgi:4-hydroxy-tetrahydrodipicolinate synthase
MKPRELWSRIRNGGIPILMTPFTDDNRLDEAGLRRQIQWLFEHDAHGDLVGFLIGGTNAEFYALSEAELLRVTRIVVDEVGGRVPVLGGAMAIGTELTIELAKKVQDLGVDGLQIVNPYYVHVSQEGVLRHLERVANSVEVGIELYNNPATSGHYLTAEKVLQLIEATGDKLVCVKELSPTMHDFVRMQRLVGERAHVVDNNDPFWAHQMFAATLGCHCFMFRPDTAQLAYEFLHAAKARNLAGMQAVVDKSFVLEEFHLKVAREEGGWTYLQITKAAMEHLGLPAGLCRMPMLPLKDEHKRELGRILDELGLNPARYAPAATGG